MKPSLFNGAEARRRLYLRGMQGTQLAAAVGVSEASISSYLTGKRRPSPPVFLRICEALEVEPDALCVSASASMPAIAAPRNAA